MAVSNASVVLSPNLETSSSWYHHNPSSSLDLIRIHTLPMNKMTRRGLIQRVRCETSPSSDSSPLDKLKNSPAIDSNKNLCLHF